MTLEFADGTSVEVRNIFGSPQLSFGSMRDTLTIEVSPDVIGFMDLKQLFKDNPNTSVLYAISEKERSEIGKGYTILLSITDEYRKIQQAPGYFGPEETEEIYIVKLAQMTYAEHQMQLMEQSLRSKGE